MSDGVFIALIGAIGGLAMGIVGLIPIVLKFWIDLKSIKTGMSAEIKSLKSDVNEVHKVVNSRMDQMIDVIGKEKFAAGEKQGKADEMANPTQQHKPE